MLYGIIESDPRNEIVFLETGNANSGLAHIVAEHGSQFAQMGVSEAEIPGVVMKPLGEGKLVGYQGSEPAGQFMRLISVVNRNALL